MVRWGFLGAGQVATAALAPAVHAASDAVLQHAAARDLERAAALHPERAGTSYDAVLADPDVDAVYLSLSNEAHLPWTLAALAAGKHVLCEKPLGLTAAEVRQLAAAAGRAGRTLVEASWYRWHPRIRLAQQQLAAIGPVEHVSAGFTFAGVPAGNYRLDPARGGGALLDVGCYAVSACLWAAGRGLPDDVAATARLGPTGVDLDTRAVLEWDAGVTAEVHAGIDAGEGQWLVITGARGEIELRDAPYTSWKNDTELWVSDGRSTQRLPVPGTDAYRVMVEEVSSVLAGGPGWLLPLEESLQTALVLDRIRATYAQDMPPVMLTVEQVAERMGLGPTGIRTMVREHKLLGVPTEDGLRIPADALDGAEPVKHLFGVLHLLHDARFSPEEALRWLTTADDSLPGTPLQALHENRATEVKRRAQALAF